MCTTTPPLRPQHSPSNIMSPNINIFHRTATFFLKHQHSPNTTILPQNILHQTTFSLKHQHFPSTKNCLQTPTFSLKHQHSTSNTNILHQTASLKRQHSPSNNNKLLYILQNSTANHCEWVRTFLETSQQLQTRERHSLKSTGTMTESERERESTRETLNVCPAVITV